MTDIDRFLIPVEDLRRRQDPAEFQFECTEDLSPLTELVGQDRALRALQFGLGVDKAGYNIFVTGLTGTGKSTAILEYLRRAIAGRVNNHQPDDWCYVYNFEDPDRPNAIRLPAGRGKQLRDQLDELLTAVRTNVQRAFTSEEFEHERRTLLEVGQREAQAIVEAAQKEAAAAGLALNFSPMGVSLLPMSKGEVIPPEQYAALPQEERAAIEGQQREVSSRIADVPPKLRAIEREVGIRLRELDQRVVRAIMAGPFEAVSEDHREEGEVPEFLQNLQEFLVNNIQLLREQEPQGGVPPGVPAGAVGTPDPFLVFRVNLFVDNSATEGPPIVTEPNPTWGNLFGRIERKAFLGTYVSDHTLLKPGAVHKANGGYLVLNLIDVMMKPGAWDGLKRLVRTKEARLEDPMEQYGMMLTPQALRPEPVPVDFKLVITGDPMSYFLLTAHDEEFWEMFKVKADFDFQIPRTPENGLAYAGFVCAVCQRESLRHFDRTAVARLIEHGSRLVDDKDKLSARFGRLRDVIVEADYWAGEAGADLVAAEHVESAINERIHRLNLVDERLRDFITRGTIMVDTEGSVVGQVNGLAVLDYGDISFGRPSRITARTFLGQRGVASIDRESQLSGKIHDKGVLTLSGYLGSKYAHDKPLSLSASITFEQGYDAVDGDSASLAELCAVLSSLAEIPIRQDLAMTGSVNQKGEVQPIGGANQKIEGFHDLCSAVGFSGTQGVVIPERNRRNLMLRGDVLESVERGDFRILSVGSVDDALQALTGVPAGERQEDGTYPEASVHYLVDKRLREMGEAMRQFGRKPKEEGTPDKPEADILDEPVDSEEPEARKPRRRKPVKKS